MKRMKYVMCCTVILVSMLFTTSVPPVSAVSASSSYLLLYLNNKEAFINNEKVMLDSPATVINGSTFVPAKFLADTFGFPLNFDAAKNTIQLEPGNASIQVNLKSKYVIANGMFVPYNEVVQMVNGRLMFKLTWIMEYTGAKYTYNSELDRIEIFYVKRPQGLMNGAGTNSKPVAKFTFGKAKYRMGEKIKYVDLSYDVDGDGIVSHKWTNNREAFFSPGRYTILLQVKDKAGNISDTYSRDIIIEDVKYMDELEFQIFNKPIGGSVGNRDSITKKFSGLPMLNKTVTEDQTRPLIVSDSPETIKQKGILYQEKVKGKARLYAFHQNGMSEKLQYTILATNQTDKTITIKTSRKGEVYPSLYMNLIGHQTLVDFLLNESNKYDVVVPPMSSKVYVQFPDFAPNEGVNMLYDVETDGELTFSFMATDMIYNMDSTYDYPQLDYVNHVRGTFQVSRLNWNIDASNLTKPSRVTIGDGEYDKFVTGYDNQRMQVVSNKGNYGVEYHLHIDHPKKMAVLLLSRAGVFKGPFKVNDDFVMIPQSGVVTAFDGLQILAKTDGNEQSLDIDFVPPGASAFPIDLIFYPLNDKN